VRPAASFLARGLAIFYGAFALLAVAAELRGRTTDLALWWIDLRELESPARLFTLVVVGAAFLAWALGPSPVRAVRVAAAAAAVAVTLVAVRDTFVFAQVVLAGRVHPFVPVPFSAVTAGLFVLSVVAILTEPPARARMTAPSALAVLTAAVACAVAFPLAQILWFGTTDYRRSADAAVVFGARVYADGRPSPLLADRIRTGIELYRSHLVPRLVMSGGDGVDGVNEARAMASVAVAQGVPPEAIDIDPAGNSTEATVANTSALLGTEASPRAIRLIAVSQPYHLPRIQLAFSNAGIDVLTVPASETQPIPELPLYIVREVPAFWAYLVRVSLG
jgi:vancomycin permeability regulator SanA